MPAKNLILYVILRRKKLLLIKAARHTLWGYPGGRRSLTCGLTHAARHFLKPYFRDLIVVRVRYLQRVEEELRYGNEFERIILVACTIRATVKKDMRDKVWFSDPSSLVSHNLIPGTLDILELDTVRRLLA